MATLDELGNDRGAQSARQPGLSGGHHANGLREITRQMAFGQVPPRAPAHGLQEQGGRCAPAAEQDDTRVRAEMFQRRQRRQGVTLGARSIEQQR
ncbi:MAG: hypothetical protein DMD76_14910 [Candidatus Rokuibacteriota bacterium]|nr:MAG: hypothetical protein DMD76_14910 [Candidatus Rokubacteria bacterium]